MDSSKTQRQIVLEAKQRRPNDWWPRGDGHVVLGTPGEPTRQKGYHEPGGSFSPSPGSFGVALWVLDSAGTVIATSDSIPIEQIGQHFVWDPDKRAPAIATTTPYYRCVWSVVKSGQWQLTVQGIPKGVSVQVIIRSAGPAGGPLENLSWDGAQLLLNRRWVVQGTPAPVSVNVGSEEAASWTQASVAKTSHADADGWGYARITLAAAPVHTFTLRDTVPQFRSPLVFDRVKSMLEMDLPDKRFVTSLNAQAAHLMMGFEGNQTRPGEPVNYPLAWERDGAYGLVAMARCGQLDLARELGVYFAENDYFGGFGAEGDAPGSAIGALVDVASILKDPEFSEWLWPHVERKAALIYEMLSATQRITKEWIGPIVPSCVTHPLIPVICDATRNGLIAGTMDHHFPILYVNAISYRGLRQAAKLATRLGKPAEAQRFLETAAVLQCGWQGGFQTDEAKNERTYMSSLWPSWVAAKDPAPFREKLETRWQTTKDAAGAPLKRPLWTYFNAGEAHQWLFLDEPDRVWQTLAYFWATDCSPGLYAYWEGNGEENAFRQWENIRGWLAPRYVTPHYWTAAEMLLLQLDMLAYVSEFEEAPVLVIGAGVPATWLKHLMRVQGLPTSLGLVSWAYRDNKVTVDVAGSEKCAVRLGSGFGKDTKLVVRRKG